VAIVCGRKLGGERLARIDPLITPRMFTVDPVRLRPIDITAEVESALCQEANWTIGNAH